MEPRGIEPLSCRISIQYQQYQKRSEGPAPMLNHRLQVDDPSQHHTLNYAYKLFMRAEGFEPS